MLEMPYMCDRVPRHASGSERVGQPRLVLCPPPYTEYTFCSGQVRDLIAGGSGSGYNAATERLRGTGSFPVLPQLIPPRGTEQWSSSSLQEPVCHRPAGITSSGGEDPWLVRLAGQPACSAWACEMATQSQPQHIGVFPQSGRLQAAAQLNNSRAEQGIRHDRGSRRISHPRKTKKEGRAGLRQRFVIRPDGLKSRFFSIEALL